MTKKLSPIEEYKGADLILGRKELLKIINKDSATGQDIKNKIEAIKLLARMHKALQVDKTIVKADAKAGVAVQLSPDVQAKIDKDVEEILERNRTSTTENPCLMS